VSIQRALTLGFLAAIVFLLAAIAGGGLGEWGFTAVLALPLLALAAAGSFDLGAAGWLWRLARAVVGGVLGFVSGLATFRWLSDVTDWFSDVHEPLVVLFLAALTAACGVVAAAATRPSRGFALASGLILGFDFLMTVGGLFKGGELDTGFVVGFTIMLGSGALVGALLGKFAR
jgi:hypothetical protein